MSYYWADERTEELKTLWAEGLSASQIARKLGGITRNAVIGKIHRLGLNTREGPAQARREKTGKARQPRAAKPLLAPVPEPEALRLESGAFVTLLTAERVHCRFPLGDPLDADFHYCGNVVVPSARYCPHHYGRVYQAQPKRERPTQYKTWGTPI